MESNKNKPDEQFKLMLEKVTKPAKDIDLTQSIMHQIQTLEFRKKIIDKNIRKSWFFIVLATILSLKGISYIKVIYEAFANSLNSYLPGSFDVFSFILMTLVAGIILFQFNALLANKYTNS